MADKVDGFLINPAALTRFGAPTKIAFAAGKAASPCRWRQV